MAPCFLLSKRDFSHIFFDAGTRLFASVTIVGMEQVVGQIRIGLLQIVIVECLNLGIVMRLTVDHIVVHGVERLLPAGTLRMILTFDDA